VLSSFVFTAQRANNLVAGLTTTTQASYTVNSLNANEIFGYGPHVVYRGQLITFTRLSTVNAGRYVVIMSQHLFLTICELRVYGAGTTFMLYN